MTAPPDWWSDEQREASLRAVLAHVDAPPRTDIWVFGYGSLLWNPGFAPTARRAATLGGYHRRFCMLIRRIRGSEEAPGLMMALDEGGACAGVALKLDPTTAQDDLAALWRREMVSDIYRPTWTALEATDGGPPLRALAFLANRAHGRYDPRPVDEAAALIAVAAGSAGRCSDYLFETSAELRRLGIADAGIEELCERVRARMPEAAR